MNTHVDVIFVSTNCVAGGSKCVAAGSNDMGKPVHVVARSQLWISGFAFLVMAAAYGLMERTFDDKRAIVFLFHLQSLRSSRFVFVGLKQIEECHQ